MTDTDKLTMILEHAEEYYENTRQYKFVTGGFVSYELFKTDEGVGLYIADIFVRKHLRGSKVFSTLIEFCLAMEHTHHVDVAYARTEKSNKYIESLKFMYESIGFVVHSEDAEAVTYRLDV
jgi:GNAT superfamily N-acetyltransferase